MKNFKNMRNIGQKYEKIKEVGGNPWLPDPRSSIIRIMATLTPFYYN